MAKKPDISHHHPVKNWEKVRSNVEFLISKATQGTTFTDSTLDNFIKNCEAQKIPYWLFTFLEKGDGAKQAEYFVKKCKNKVGKHFVGYIIDAEKNPSTGTYPTDSQVKAALNYLSKQGVKYGLYTGFADYSRYKESITKAKNATNGFWWEARYGNNDGAYNSKYPCNKGVSLHQFTSLGTCDGISGKIDLNRITGQGKGLDWFKSPLEEVKIIIGSARIDESGKVSGGKAGDQKQISSTNDTKGEVSMQDFYVHSKGWYVLRPKDAKVAKKIANAMKQACNNANIGYDQSNRLGIIKYGTATQTKTECDCSSLVRQCIKEATGKDVGNFVTTNEPHYLEKSGLFDDRITYESGVKLYTGDIIVTKIKGHTAVVVEGYERTNTSSSSKPTTSKTYSGTFPTLPPRGYYKKGDGITTLTNYPTQIKRVQMFLNWAIDAGLTVDGKYGANTTSAVKTFQKKYGLTIDGMFGNKTLAKAKIVNK